MTLISPEHNYWITCITREGYLKGAKVLLKSLQAVESKYSLILMVPKNLSTADLEGEPNLIIMQIESYALPSSCKTSYAFDRFSDVWNKLLCWTVAANMVCWLDSDMLIIQNMDDVFDMLPADKKLGACPGNTTNTHQ
jgi:alpha-N-acetylglucosamine transferase